MQREQELPGLTQEWLVWQLSRSKVYVGRWCIVLHGELTSRHVQSSELKNVEPYYQPGRYIQLLTTPQLAPPIVPNYQQHSVHTHHFAPTPSQHKEQFVPNFGQKQMHSVHPVEPHPDFTAQHQLPMNQYDQNVETSAVTQR